MLTQPNTYKHSESSAQSGTYILAHTHTHTLNHRHTHTHTHTHKHAQTNNQKLAGNHKHTQALDNKFTYTQAGEKLNAHAQRNRSTKK